VVSFTHRPHYPQGKSTWYPLYRRLGGPKAVLDAVIRNGRKQIIIKKNEEVLLETCVDVGLEVNTQN
jgi:hypothetical protein